MARTPSRAALFFTGYAMQRALERRLADASAALSAIPGIGSGAMGLTPDAVKVTPAYREARARYHAAHAALANHNRHFVRTFKKELAATIHAMRIAKRDARTAAQVEA